MKKVSAALPEIKLVGLSARTNNKNEMNPATSKIGELAGRYWGGQLASQITHRVNPNVTMSVYTDYETDENGDYTYFVGEAVSSFDSVPEGFTTLTIPAASYQKFTTEAGKMPDIVIEAWMKIWQMTPTDLGHQRAYIADFEVYDQRASDPVNTSVDIFVGIQA